MTYLANIFRKSKNNKKIPIEILTSFMNPYEKNDFHDITIHLLIIRDFKMICSSNIFSFLNLVETGSRKKQLNIYNFVKVIPLYIQLWTTFIIHDSDRK